MADVVGNGENSEDANMDSCASSRDVSEQEIDRPSGLKRHDGASLVRRATWAPPFKVLFAWFNVFNMQR